MAYYEKKIGKKGHITYTFNGKYIYSSYDPYREAKYFIGNLKSLKKKVITCCGADFINLELLNRGISEIISIEPIMFDHLTDHNNIRRLSTFDEFKSFIKDKNEFEYSLIIWQPYIETSPDSFLPFLNKIKEYIKKLSFSKKTESFFSFIEFKNFINNIFLSRKKYTFLSSVKDRSRNPAVIISSGYSLYQNIDFIRKIRNHAYLFSLPSSLPFLYENHIFPDFVLAVDPGYATYYHLCKYHHNIKLISPLTINSSVFNLENFDSLIINYNSYPESIFFDSFDMISTQPEGTVFMNLLRILPQLGFYDIIIAGQDFGYYKERSHINEGYFESEFRATACYINNLESKIKSLETSKDFTYINDGTKKIKTDLPFSIYYDHFIQQSFDLNLYLTENPYNLLNNRYKTISSGQIKNKYPELIESPQPYNISVMNDFEDRTDKLLMLFSEIDKNEITTKLSGFKTNNNIHNYLLNKYSRILIDRK